MKLNDFGRYLLYLGLVILLLVKGDMLIWKEIQSHYPINFSLITLYNFIFFGGIGAILGMDHLLPQFKKDGKWKLNFAKLLILGIPSLIFLSPASMVLWYPQIPATGFSFLISGVVLGYTLITSFVRET